MYSYSNKKQNNNILSAEEVDIKVVFDTLKRYKKSIFIVAFMVTFVSALYTYFSTSIYQADLTLQVHEQTANTPDPTGQDQFMQQAIAGQQSNNIDDEIAILQSTFVATKALESLDLGKRYFVKNGLKTVEFYKDAPFKIVAQSMSKYMLDYSFHINPIDATHFRLTVSPTLLIKLRYLFGGDVQLIRFSEVYTYGQPIESKDFHIEVDKTGDMSDAEYIFTVKPNLFMTDFILSSLTVAPTTDKSNVLLLSFDDTIPQRGQDVLNAIANAYQEQSIEVKNSSANKKLAFIDKQLDQINKTLQVSASKLQGYQSSHSSIDVKDKGTMLAQQITTYENQISDLDMQKSVLQNLAQQIKSDKDVSGIGLSSPAFANSPILTLISQLQAAYVQKTSLNADYTPKHPSVIKNNQQIQSITKNLLGTIESNIQGIVKQKAILADSIGKIKSQMSSLPEEQKDIASLSNNVDVNQKLYEYLLQQRAQTAIVETSKISNIRVIDEAAVEQLPIKPKRMLIILIGMILGLITGVAQALFRNYLENTVESISDVEKHTSLPIYTVLPFFRDKKTLYEDALRVLLTKLEFEMGKPKMITITSSVQGEGRTTTALEFAKVIAQSSRKVIVVDLDLRRSSVHTKLNLSNAKGMSNLLAGTSTLEDVIQTVDTNLDIIAAGPVPSNPYGLIMSSALETLMTQLREKYDYIIVESPAAGLVPDALVLMRMSDINFMVLKAKYSKKDFLENTNRFVSEHKLENVGIILNGLELNKIRPWFKNKV